MMANNYVDNRNIKYKIKLKYKTGFLYNQYSTSRIYISDMQYILHNLSVQNEKFKRVYQI